MSAPSLAESPGLVQPCAVCGQFEATITAPASEPFDAQTPICEVCGEVHGAWGAAEPIPQPVQPRAFVWVDLEFLELVRPLLTAVEFCTYLAAVQLCDGRRGLSSQAKLARAANLSRRNVVDAVELLIRVGLVVNAGSYGSKGSRYLVVREALIGADPARPCLLRPGVYQDAQDRLLQLGRKLPAVQTSDRRSRVRAIGDPGSRIPVIREAPIRDPGITGIRDRGITASPYYDPKGIQQTNKQHGSPTHPPSDGGPGPAGPVPIFEQAAESAADSWPAYSLAVLTDRAAVLVGWADEHGEAVTAEQAARFLREGASADWLRRGAERAQNPIGSTLHVWCDQQRWIRWLRKDSAAAARRAEHSRAAEVRELPKAERLRIRDEAAAIAAGRVDLRTLGKDGT